MPVPGCGATKASGKFEQGRQSQSSFPDVAVEHGLSKKHAHETDTSDRVDRKSSLSLLVHQPVSQGVFCNHEHGSQNQQHIFDQVAPTAQTQPDRFLQSHDVSNSNGAAHYDGRKDQAPLLVQQAGVHHGAEGLRRESSQGPLTPGAPGASARDAQASGVDCQLSGPFHHEADQGCQARRVASPVLKPRDSIHQPSFSGRTSPCFAPACDQQCQRRNSHGDRSPCRRNLQRDLAQLPQVCRVGNSGSEPGGGRRLAPDPVCQVGREGEPGTRAMGSSRDLCARQCPAGHSGEHEPQAQVRAANDHQEPRASRAGHPTRNDAHDEEHDGRISYHEGRAPGAQESVRVSRLFQESQDHHEPDELRAGGIEVSDSTDPDTYEEPTCLHQTLTEAEGSQLREAANRMLPEQWASVASINRLFLLEVACSESSTLTNEARKQGLRAERAGLFNGCDLTTPEGLRKVLKLVEEGRPEHVWISTECGAFSPMQNLNQRSDQQVQDLKEKQRDARKQHLGGLVVAYFARSQGSHIHWEWSRRCRAWKWKLMDRMKTQMKLHTAIVGGCRVGLKDPKTQKVVGKEWRIETTNERFACKVHLPCLREQCPKEHVVCEGSLTRMSAFYPETMAKRVIHHLRNQETWEELQPQLTTKGLFQGELFSKYGQVYNPKKCNCDMFQDQGLVQVCSHCILQRGDHQIFVGEQEGENPEVEEAEEARQKHDWEKKFRLIHSATGHGDLKLLVEALQQKGVDPKVLEWAKSFRCHICEERKKPGPRRVANFEVIPKRWKVVLADCMVWRDPRRDKRAVIGLFMDQGSRFLVGKVLVEGATNNVKAEQYMEFYQTHWQTYFGNPEILRYDAEGTWRSRKLDEFFSKKQIMLDAIPGDAHWHISPLERSVAWLKENLSRQTAEDPDFTTQDGVAMAISIWNQREMVRGFSPYQHALGRTPDLSGRLFDSEVQGLPIELM